MAQVFNIPATDKVFATEGWGAYLERDENGDYTFSKAPTRPGGSVVLVAAQPHNKGVVVLDAAAFEARLKALGDTLESINDEAHDAEIAAAQKWHAASECMEAAFGAGEVEHVEDDEEHEDDTPESWQRAQARDLVQDYFKSRSPGGVDVIEIAESSWDIEDLHAAVLDEDSGNPDMLEFVEEHGAAGRRALLEAFVVYVEECVEQAGGYEN